MFRIVCHIAMQLLWYILKHFSCCYAVAKIIRMFFFLYVAIKVPRVLFLCVFFFSHIVRQFLSTSQFTGFCKSDATFLHTQPDLRFHSCSQHKHCRIQILTMLKDTLLNSFC